ncbi:MAG: EAL domain-containing protein [Pseudomonadota bacterium]
MKMSDTVVPFPAAPAPANESLSIQDVQEALWEGRMELHYQPQYCLSSGRTVAAEALVRLRDREDNLVYPGRFITQLEESSLIVPFGRAVITQVCADLAAMKDQQLPLPRFPINLAANQLNLDDTLADFVAGQLADYGLAPGDLEFELTERQGFSAASAGAGQLIALAELGSRIVLDDFGIGHARAETLKGLPISAIKIDRVVLRDSSKSVARLGMLEGILVLASRLGLEVIVEGIETIGQERLLQTLGFRWGQGFFYAKPMPAESLLRFLGDQIELPAKQNAG